MALRDLIVHLDQGESAHGRLRLAANLAQRHGSRLTAIYMRQQNEAQSDLQRTAEMARASCKDFDRIRKRCYARLAVTNESPDLDVILRLQASVSILEQQVGTGSVHISASGQSHADPELFSKDVQHVSNP